MWRWIEEQREIQDLTAKRISWSASFAQERLEAKLNGASFQQLYEMSDRQQRELRQYDDEIQDIQTKRLVRRALKLGVPIDRSPELWDESPWTGTQLLTVVGFHNLRKAVREEHTSRRAAVISVLSALTGLAVSPSAS